MKFEVQVDPKTQEFYCDIPDAALQRPISFRDLCAIEALKLVCKMNDGIGTYNHKDCRTDYFADAINAFDIADAMEAERQKRSGQ